MNTIIRNVLTQRGYPLNKEGLVQYLKDYMPDLLMDKFYVCFTAFGFRNYIKNMTWKQIINTLFPNT